MDIQQEDPQNSEAVESVTLLANPSRQRPRGGQDSRRSKKKNKKHKKSNPILQTAAPIVGDGIRYPHAVHAENVLP